MLLSHRVTLKTTSNKTGHFYKIRYRITRAIYTNFKMTGPDLMLRRYLFSTFFGLFLSYYGHEDVSDIISEHDSLVELLNSEL